MESKPRPPTPRKANHQKFQFGPWTVSTCKSHILESEGPIKRRYDEELELPQLPEMVFAESNLRVVHESGCGLEFNSLDALRLVDAHSGPTDQVAAAKEWMGARSECEHIKNVVSPFDWTYSTSYKGTIVQEKSSSIKVSTTTERIDIEKLKKREPIHFFDEVLLFEDELSDNGTSMLSVKIRVMPSCFFILMRFFVRVDQVFIRVYETRIYHEAGSNIILREHSSKEEKTSKIPTSAQTDPNEVSQYLQLTSELFEKLELPSS